MAYSGLGGLGGAGSYTDLIKQWGSIAEQARLSNLERSKQISAIYDEIIRRYEPGGTFGKAALGQLEEQKVRDVGAEMQQMISSGLYGTTTAAGAPRRWESAVGAPARLKLEDIMMERLSQAQVGKAGFLERIEEPYPPYSALAGLIQQAASAPTGGTITGGVSGVGRPIGATGISGFHRPRAAGAW